MQRLKDSSAMIFPSLSESFGLPMLEAQANGISVIASELDFVRDVCLPSETFDPGSPISIARAVMRFMGVVEHHHTPLSATEFLKELIGKDL
jgi:glycosyltransferase involved in cell wall biosynthesis